MVQAQYLCAVLGSCKLQQLPGERSQAHGSPWQGVFLGFFGLDSAAVSSILFQKQMHVTICLQLGRGSACCQSQHHCWDLLGDQASRTHRELIWLSALGPWFATILPHKNHVVHSISRWLLSLCPLCVRVYLIQWPKQPFEHGILFIQRSVVHFIRVPENFESSLERVHLCALCKLSFVCRVHFSFWRFHSMLSSLCAVLRCRPM